MKSHFQDVKTGECFRLDHLIKQHFEKVMADKKTSAEEKEALSLTVARLDGMTMVCDVLLIKLKGSAVCSKST